MAADLTTIKTDLDRVDDACLDEVRRLVDACLHVSPEDDLADQGVLAVLTDYLADNDGLVRMVIVSRQGNQIITTVQTSNQPTPGFIPSILWLFIWANKRKG